MEEARVGRNLVIQGPPGTGKSQTIANIIAAAVHSNRSVLFVAEKAAALDVVHGRLKAEGLEPLYLELHSRKATKAAVVSSLDRALSASGAVSLDHGIVASLRATRDRLNGWSETLHRQIGRSGRTPYHVMGQVLQLHTDNIKQLSERLDTPGEWTAEQLGIAEHSVDRAAAATKKLGIAPSAHPWRGATGDLLTPFDADRLREAVEAAGHHIEALSASLRTVREILGCPVGYQLEDIPQIASGLRHLARMPSEGRAALLHPAWRANRKRISSLYERGCHWFDRRAELEKQVFDVVWRMELEAVRRTITVFGQSTFRVLRGEYRRAVAELNSICRSSPPKTYADRVRLLDELIVAQQARRWLVAEASFAEAVLGDLWAGEASSWPKIQALIIWVERSDEIVAGIDPLRAEVISASVPWEVFAAEIEHSAADLRSAMARIVSLTGTEPAPILGATR